MNRAQDISKLYLPGVTYVSMLILLLKYEPLGKVETGHVKDQTGIDIGGGGTTDVDVGVLYRL